MARTDGRNSNTPNNILINTDPSKILENVQKEAAKENVSLKDNQRLREILQDITKEFQDQTSLLKKQQEYRNADLQSKAQMLRSDIESLELMQQTVTALEKKLALSKDLSEEEQAYLNAAKKQQDNINAGIEYRQTLLQNQQKWYDDAIRKNSSLIQKTENLKNKLASAAKQKKDLEEQKLQEEVKHDLKVRDLNLQKESGLISQEEYESSLNAEDEHFDEVTRKLDLGIKELSTLGTIASVIQVVSKTLNMIQKSVDQGIDKAAADRAAYQGRVTSRLQGLSDINFDKIADDAAAEYANSAYVSQTKFLQSVDKLSSQGIAYNLENRALIETLGEKLVSTFDTLDATLTRLTRIQQSDLTVSQLGAEAKLTQLLNSMFQDTSYLNGLYDNVSSTLLDAAALMNIDDATSFMYNVQKWLGSLYSLGVSDQGVQTIAQGLSYLGSGNVTALNSNAPLQTLIVQSLTRAGMNYADVLANGLTANTTNKLLQAMVENLQDISNNTSSKVLRSAWGNIIGLNTTDLQAIRNLSASDIVSIASSTTNYKNAIDAASEQLNQLDSRTFISEKLDNFINNTFYTIGSKLARDSGAYLTYNIARNLEGVFGGSEIAKIAFGTAKFTSLASAFGTEKATKELGGQRGFLGNLLGDTAVGGFVDSIQKVLDGISNFIDFAGNTVESGVNLIEGNADLPSWLNFQQFTSRGDMLLNATPSAASGGVVSGVSYSGAYGVKSDLGTMFDQNAELVSASYETRSDYTRTITRSASDIYHELFEAQTTPIRIRLADIEDIAMNKLLLTSGGNYPVDILDTDIDKVSDAIKALQLVRNDYYFD